MQREWRGLDNFLGDFLEDIKKYCYLYEMGWDSYWGW